MLYNISLIRPDISFTVNKLAQFMHQATELHWIATKQLLFYLKNTLHHGLFLKRQQPLHITTLMQIGREIVMIEPLPLLISSTLVAMLFLGTQRNQKQSLVHPLRHGIVP